MPIITIRAASALAALALLSGASLSACKIIDEKPCSDGEYPTRARGGGEACFPIGQTPTPPYETYPPGYTPTTVPEDNPAPDATDYGWTPEPTRQR